MEQGLKERLVGAAVLVILAVIFIPMLLDDSQRSDPIITETNIPPKPDNLPTIDESDFNSRVIPIESEVEEQIPENDAKISDESDVTVTGNIDDNEREDAEPETEQGVIDETDTDIGLSAWAVQLGSFESEENAQTLNRKLRDSGYTSFVEPLKQDNEIIYRVRIGPELKRSDAQSILEKLEKSFNLEGIVVSYP